MEKYEYKIQKINYRMLNENALNTLGNEGWELVMSNSLDERYEFIFKKKKSE